VPFKTILKDLVQSVPGATGAILTDWEGEAVEYYSVSDNDYDLKILGAHQNIILNRVREVRDRIPSQTVRETVISTDLQHLVLGAVGNDYTLVMVLERNALVGRAVVRTRCSVGLLEKEIY
jgi:predicted regulator of Ras-like GTPase activity (Roadblock/LC7/MglB family)